MTIETNESSPRPYELVVFGATGFAGGLTAEYLATTAQENNLTWAIAGRNPEKLSQLKARLEQINPDCKNIGIIEASADDPRSLYDMASQARVVITTVGPYIRYGEPLVKACIEASTDYVDLTGEPEFVELIEHDYHDMAQEKGVKIVNCCGFDSIPHDLGALYALNALNELIGPDLAGTQPVTIEGFVKAKGTFSGGTWHSAITAFERIRNFQKQKKRWKKSAGTSAQGLDGRKVRGVPIKLEFNRSLSAWVCPFPTIDPQVVRRTAKLRDKYGPDFKYGHYIQVRKLPKLVAGAIGLGGIVLLSQIKATRELLLKIKDPGAGPSQQEIEKGWFKVTMMGESNGIHVWAEISGGDPGYGETSKMLAESALCLAKNREQLPPYTGVVTPGAAMGEALIERLQKAGIGFRLL